MKLKFPFVSIHSLFHSDPFLIFFFLFENVFVLRNNSKVCTSCTPYVEGKKNIVIDLLDITIEWCVRYEPLALCAPFAQSYTSFTVFFLLILFIHGVTRGALRAEWAQRQCNSQFLRLFFFNPRAEPSD